MKLLPIERVSGLTRKDFEEEYMKKSKPVVITDIASQWEATEKWTFKWLQDNYGHLEVPLYDNAFRDPGKDYLTPKIKMPFGDYLEIIQEGPTELRMFLYNIFKHAPELTSDFSMPTLTDGWLKNLPMMFFGGQGAKVDLHYDLDCASIFITHFQTTKKVILFGPDQSDYLYQHPFTVQSEVKLDAPDFKKHPALEHATGYDIDLAHGETLFMPHLWWHYMYYTVGGFSLSLRRHSAYTFARGSFNVARHFVVDKGMNLMLGDKWTTYKANKAQKRASAVLSTS